MCGQWSTTRTGRGRITRGLVRTWYRLHEDGILAKCNWNCPLDVHIGSAVRTGTVEQLPKPKAKL